MLLRSGAICTYASVPCRRAMLQKHDSHNLFFPCTGGMLRTLRM